MVTKKAAPAKGKKVEPKKSDVKKPPFPPKKKK